jgi:hypothetical protein
MPCLLLDYVFAAATRENPPSPIQVELTIQQGGIIINNSNPTLAGSGPLAYTPWHRINFPNSPFFFYAPPLYSGVIPCTATWQTPQGPQTAPQDVTVQIASPFVMSLAYSISLSSPTEIPVDANGAVRDFNCRYTLGKSFGSIEGLLGESPVQMGITFDFEGR